MGCISVRVDDRRKRELEAEAKEQDVRPSDVVRQVLERHVRDRPMGSKPR